jgi:glycosyltransferase involved in cell wall biosynthesis
MISEASKVTCIMPTFNRRPFVARAVRYILAQDYSEKELVIVDDGTESIADLVPQDPRLRYFRQEKKQRLRAKRNFAC